jgi:hypothetical protein
MAFLEKGEKCKGDSQDNSAAATTILTDAMEQILTKKEMKVDLFLNTVADYISEELQEKNRGDEQQPPQQKKFKQSQLFVDNEESRRPPSQDDRLGGCAAGGASEENKQELLDLADDRLSGLSILMNHKFGNILKQHLVLKEETKAAKNFSHIYLPLPDLKKMSIMYKECFNSWVDSPFVNYVAYNKLLLGALSEKDCLILHLFAFLTCYRAKGDNLYAVCISGCSTAGKTMLFENPILANGHQHVAEAGVGRWIVGKRSVLCYHDIPLDRLVRGADGDKFKTICRSERSTCKIFGSTSVLPPLFVFITSNQNIQTHQIVRRPSTKSFFFATSKCEQQTSKLNSIFSAKKQEQMKESICAVKSRVIEAFVSQRPILDQANIPTSGNFSRQNAILGMFERVIVILEKHDTNSFYGAALWSYAITGLVSNVSTYQQIIRGSEAVLMTKRLRDLLTKFVKEESALLKYVQRMQNN